MKWLKYSAIALGAVLLLLFAAAWWLLGSNAGARFALARAHGLTDGALSVQHVQGRLLGPLRLSGVRYDDGQGLRLDIAQAHLELRAWPLWSARIHARALDLDGVRVVLPESTQPAETSTGFTLDPPVDMVLDHAHVGTLQVQRGTHVLFASNSLDVSGSWTHAGLTVRQFDLRAADGYAKLQGTLQPASAYRGSARASFAWKVDDRTYAGALVARSDGQRAQLAFNLSRPATAQLQVDAALDGRHAWTAELTAPRFEPAAFLGDNPIQSAAIAVRAHGDRRAGTLDGQVTLNDYELVLQPLRAQLNDDFTRLTVQQLKLISPQIKGRLQASGSVQLDAQPVRAKLALHWNDVILPAKLAGQVLASTGQLDVDGSPASYHATGALDIGPPGKPGKFALNLDGSPQQITLRTLDWQQAKGNLQAHGTLTLQPELAWQLQASASRFDPGQLLSGWTGALDFDLASNGSLSARGADTTLDLRKLGGRLRGHSVSGSGVLHFAPDAVLDGRLDLASDHSNVHIIAKPGGSNHVDVALAIASLGDWWPDASGSMDGHFAIAGKWPKLSINGQAHGQALHWQQQRIDALQLIVGVPDTTRLAGKIDLRISGVHTGGLTFQHIAALAEGSQGDHRLMLDVHGTQLSAELVVHGALKTSSAWAGTLSTLSVAPQGMPAWRLQQPVQLAYAAGAMSLSEACLSAGEPQLCVTAQRGKNGTVDASYRLHALPLALLLDASGQAKLPVHVDGSLDGSGTLQRTAAGALRGDAGITSATGSVTYADRPDETLLHYDQLSLRATFAPGQQRIDVHAGLGKSGRLDGQLTMTGTEQALDGRLAVGLDRLTFIELLDDDLANVTGSLDGNFQFAGTLQYPLVTGRAAVNDFAGEVPGLGLKLAHGTLVVGATDPEQPFHVTGSVQSGTGQLAVTGTADIGANTHLALAIKGHQVTAVDIPAAKVVVAPDLTLRQDADGLHLGGTLGIDSADVDVDKLPGSGATQASADVVIVDAQQQEQAARKLPFSAQVKIDLGRKTHLVAMGLDGHLGGVLTVSEQPGRATTGQGQLAVDGTYRAYGQNLHIQHGLLLFASTPLANPGLNIRAVRQLNPNATIDEGQEVGLLITGMAQRPVLTVFSNPAMEQSDALSYLVTGKPLSAVNSGEGDVVNAAAQALGSAAGNLLAKRVGAELGIEDIGVTSSAALGGSSAFTVGKFLSPRLYLSYGIGLFEPGQVITLRYRLSVRWNLEAQQATEFSRGSLNYRIER